MRIMCMILELFLISLGILLSFAGLSLESKLAGDEIYDVIVEEEIPEGTADKWAIRLNEKICGPETENVVEIVMEEAPKGYVDSYGLRLEEKLCGPETDDLFVIMSDATPLGGGDIYRTRLEEKLKGVEID